MSESFAYPESESLFRQLEEVSQRSSVSRDAAFQDWLTAMTCALAAETMEDEYLRMVERHQDGQPGRRSIDLMGTMFGELVAAMTRYDRDVLGDLFQSAVSHQERGQFFTPESLTQLLGELTVDSPEESARCPEITISDPCCGTGRMLLDAARRHPNAQVHGVDIDARCAKIAAINLGLRNHYGWILCGNSLSQEHRFAFRVAPFFHETGHGTRRGVLRRIPVERAAIDHRDAFVDQNATSLFDGDDSQPDESVSTSVESILEIPRWALRVERVLESTEIQSPSGNRPADTHEDQSGDEESKTQKKLF